MRQRPPGFSLILLNLRDQVFDPFELDFCA
jgi:hypothetical protein